MRSNGWPEGAREALVELWGKEDPTSPKGRWLIVAISEEIVRRGYPRYGDKTIASMAARMNLSSLQARTFGLPDFIRDKTALLAQTMTTGQMAAHFGVGKDAIRHRCQTWGIKPLPSRGRPLLQKKPPVVAPDPMTPERVHAFRIMWDAGMGEREIHERISAMAGGPVTFWGLQRWRRGTDMRRLNGWHTRLQASVPPTLPSLNAPAAVAERSLSAMEIFGRLAMVECAARRVEIMAASDALAWARNNKCEPRSDAINARRAEWGLPQWRIVPDRKRMAPLPDPRTGARA